MGTFTIFALERVRTTDQALLPSELELDTFGGDAWISALPFRVTHQRFRGFPELPLMNTFLEINVRTYVKYKDLQGVYFFSLDANHPLTVLGAKTLALPYKHASMAMEEKNKVVDFKSNRLFTGNHLGKFAAIYKPVGEPCSTVQGSLDHWLLERYCLFTKWGNQILRGDIHHDKWRVNKVDAKIVENTVGPFGSPPESPLLHYALSKMTFVWPLKKG
ncbi:DUF2071 domain-containing protein [Neobacillus sp. PS3-40]|uniref:YqjF family protein n=1 Tax=Neobacillus sp. PS3-40 TaxID=3070679 RepID=UPI0027E2113E|nr:DUF2071 domain-containing protein [Neobacillus sp. PS3-40]WML46021.1 DUF2071 domain-containing protein [Neobacillus sp. PS3-40]